MNCDHCQNLLLDHLYGLLDGAEAAVVDAHLAGCADCAAARAETARVQGLIARAAKAAFPGTRFEPPVSAPQPAPLPAAPPTRTPAPGTAAPPRPAAPARGPAAPAHPARRAGVSRRVAAVVPWAVAAAVLLAVPGTVVPVLSAFDRAAAAQRDADAARHAAEVASRDVRAALDDRERALRGAQDRYTQARQNEKLILDQWVGALREVGSTGGPRRLTVDVRKPVTVQPGAPNDFLVVVRDSRENWETRGKLVAEVHAVDASDAVVYTQPLDHQRHGDTHPLRLPAAAWTKVRPEAELYLVVAQVDERSGARTELQERVKLAGPVYTTLLTTDRPAYAPGDRVFFRSLTLDRVTFRPPAREQILRYELLDAGRQPVRGVAAVAGTTDLVRVSPAGKVEPVLAADGRPVRGVGCGEFVLPAALADGDYTLVLREQPHPGGFPPAVAVDATRTIKVRAERDAYAKRIEFKGRASYTAGETVEAWAELQFQDRPAADVPVAGVTVLVDGTPAGGAAASPRTDADGRAHVRFTLPDGVRDGDVRLKVAFRTAFGEEAVARRVPVIGTRLNVEFFPEGGKDVVAGAPCKVYVRATTPAGLAVDVRGVVTDGTENLARVDALTDAAAPGANRGLAAFTYTPRLGAPVWLKLDAPLGASAPILAGVPVPSKEVAALGGPAASAGRTGFLLPKPASDGVVMSVLDPVTAPGEPFRVRLYSATRARTLVVGAYTRGKLGDTQRVTVEANAQQVVKLLGGPDPRGGVVRITCFEEPDDLPGRPKPDLKPVAERLVFRRPGEVLNLAVSTARADAGEPPAVPTVPVPPAAPHSPAGSPAGLPVPAAVAPPVTTAPAARPAAPAPEPSPPAAAAVPPGVGGPNVNPPATRGAAMNLSIAATDEKNNPAAAVLWAAVTNAGATGGPTDRLLTTHFLLAGEVQNPDDLEYADFLLTGHRHAAEALDLVLGTQGWRRFAEQTPAPVVPAGKAAEPSAELARLRQQNGQVAPPVEATFLREQEALKQKCAALNQKFKPMHEEATDAALKAQAELDAVRGTAGDAAAAKTAEAAAAARRAEGEADRAAAARAPVLRFRANAWFAVAGLVALALGCGLVAAVRPAGRLPLGFSTLGALGLAAFLVVATGWGDRLTAAAPAAAAGDARPPVALAKGDRRAGPGADPAEHANGSAGDVAPEVGRSPLEASNAKKAEFAGGSPDGVSRAGDPAPEAKVAAGRENKDELGFGNFGRTDGKKGGAVAKPDAAPAGLQPHAMTAPPGPAGGSVSPYPLPKVALPGRGGSGAAGGFPGGGFPGGAPAAPPGGPVQRPPSLGPPRPEPATGLGSVHPPAALTAPGGSGGGHGPVPNRADGIGLGELGRGATPQAAPRTSATRRAAPADQADALTRTKEMAAQYAREREGVLTNNMNSYFADRAKEAGAAPAFAEKLAHDNVRSAVSVTPPLVVREYSAPRPAPAAFPDADDTPDTVLWQPVVVLPADGKATLAFHLGGAPGGYQVTVAGHTADGRLGATRGFVPVARAATVMPAAPAAPVVPAPPPAP